MEQHLATIDEKFSQAEGFSLLENSIVVARVGSFAANTMTADSDYDYVAIVVPPKDRLLGLKPFEHWEPPKGHLGDKIDVKVYSLQKLFRLLMKANPNILELLWLPEMCYLRQSPTFELLLHSRMLFSTKAAYHSFVGYAKNQFDRMAPGVTLNYMSQERRKFVEEIGYDPKNASRMIQLLLIAPHFLRTGELQVFLHGHLGSMVRAIKQGMWPLEEVKKVATDLFTEVEGAYNASPLPEIADWQKVNDLLVYMHDDHFIWRAIEYPALRKVMEGG